MVVVVVPDVLVGEGHHCFLQFYVNYFKTLFLQVSQCDKLFAVAKRLPVSANAVLKSQIYLGPAQFVNMDQLFLLELNRHKFVEHQGKGIGKSKLCDFLV